MPKSKRDKTTGLPLPSPVVPDTSICLSISVPNAVEYRSALKGALSALGQAWTWTQTVGEDNQASYEAAELWRNRLADAVYQLDCGVDMSCDDVADCIETSDAVKTAIQAVVPSTPIDGTTYPPGVPLTPGQMTTPLNEIDECAFDPFWAQVEQYVDYMVNLGQDVLEQIAAYSAALDAGEVVPMGQFLGKLKNSSSAGKVVEFLQWVLTVVKAQYEAADTTGNRLTIKCAIFCQNRDTCQITIEGTLDTLNERLGGLLDGGDLSDLPTMVTAFTTAIFDPTLALDLWILFLMGSAKTAGMFGMQNIDETINLVLALAVNDANNDWIAACEDCPPPVTCDGGTLFDWTLSDLSFEAWADRALWHDGEGFGVNPASGITSVVRITRSVIPHPTKVRVWTTHNQYVNLYSHEPGVSTTFIGSMGVVGEDAIGWMFELEGLGSYDNWLMVSAESTGGAMPDGFRIIRMCTDYD